MGNCWTRGPKITALIEGELLPIYQIFGEESSIMLLQPDGKLLVCLSNQNQNEITPDLISTMLTFKKTASTFGMTLQLDSRVIHIRGKSTLFSSYDIDKYSLNIFSHMSLSSEVSDTTVLDDATQRVLDSIKPLLAQLEPVDN